MPMGPAFGMDDEKYAALLNVSLRLMKALRLR
jgi:succinate-semialdehyde dehydrogenase/glutarate-semialdehyde dehydrogenase